MFEDDRCSAMLKAICLSAILLLLFSSGQADPPAFQGGSALSNKPFADDSLIPNVAAISPGEQWDRFRIMIWQYRTAVQRDIDLYREAGFTGFHIDRGIGQEKAVAFARENSLPYYVDHAAGKGILHLTKQTGLEMILRKHELIPRPQSLVDLATIAEMKRLLNENIEVTKNGPVLAYSFDDEISLGSFNSPAEVDNSPQSIAGFRLWLREKYGKVESLNESWGIELSSFENAEPVSFETIRAAHSIGPFSNWKLARWMDWRSYMDSQFASVLGDLTKFTNELDPKTPAGFVGGQQPSAYGGYDYEKLCRSVQFMEAYDIGGTNEILRSFWGGKERRPFVQTWFSTGEAKRDSWFLWYYLVHGNRGVIAWPDLGEAKGGSWFREGKGLLPHIKELAATSREVQSAVSESILARGTRFDPDPIAVFYSMPSIRASWVTDVIPHGRTWPNRSSGLDNSCQSAGKNRVAWFKILEDCGFQYNVVSAGQVAADHLIEHGYRVLILNRALCLSDEEISALKRFVESGGTIIADHWAGLLDENGNGRKVPNRIDEFFGINRKEVKGYFGSESLCELNGEKYNSPYLERLEYDGAIRKGGIVRVGEGENRDGQTVYLDRSPLEYYDSSWRVGSGGESWRKLILEIMRDKVGLMPRVQVLESGELVPMAESLFWRKGDRQVLAIVKNPTRQGSITSLGNIGGIPNEAIQVELVFQKERTGIVDLRTGEKFADGNKISLTWKPWEALLLEMDR